MRSADVALAVAAHDHGAGAIAEQHRGLRVVEVGDAREQLGADHEHTVGAAGLDLAGGQAQRGEPAGAGGADVDGAGVVGAERVGDDRRRVRRDLVGRHRRHEDEVDVARVHAGVLERTAAGEHGVVGQALARQRAAARLDAGALDDPRVVDADALGDRSVRHDLRRHVMAQPEDLRGARGRAYVAVARRLAGDRGEVRRERGATHGQAPRPASPRGSP
jgi:hypothetical protein